MRLPLSLHYDVFTMIQNSRLIPAIYSSFPHCRPRLANFGGFQDLTSTSSPHFPVRFGAIACRSTIQPTYLFMWTPSRDGMKSLGLGLAIAIKSVQFCIMPG